MNFRFLFKLGLAGIIALKTATVTAAFSVTLTDQSANTQTFSTIQPDGTIRILYSDLSAALKTDFGLNGFQLAASPNGSTASLANINTTQIQMSNTSILTSLHVLVADSFNTPVGTFFDVFNQLNLGSSDPSSGTLSGSQVTDINTTVATPTATATVTGVGSPGTTTQHLAFPVVPVAPPFTMTTDLTLTYSGANFNGNVTSSSSAQGAAGADPRGDFNFDGVINKNDIPVMLNALTDLKTFEMNAPLLSSNPAQNDVLFNQYLDADGDGKVTNRDMNYVLNYVNKFKTTSGGTANVPEPAGYLQFFMGTLLVSMAACHRRRRKACRNLV